MVAFLLRAAVTGFALWIVTLVVSGIDFVGGDTTLQRIGIILVVGWMWAEAIVDPPTTGTVSGICIRPLAEPESVGPP